MLLRKTYFFKYLPNDFFYIKPRLPEPSKIQDPEFNFNLPVQERSEAIRLLQYLSKEFQFNTPLTKEWIDLIKTTQPQGNNNTMQLKPTLPTDYNVVNSTAGTKFPITNKKDIRNNVIKTAQFFHFSRIPDEWIQIQSKPQLPDLDQLKEFVKTNNINIELPITQDESLPYKVRKLREYFSFQHLPENFITTIQLPEPPSISLNFK